MFKTIIIKGSIHRMAKLNQEIKEYEDMGYLVAYTDVIQSPPTIIVNLQKQYTPGLN